MKVKHRPLLTAALLWALTGEDSKNVLKTDNLTNKKYVLRTFSNIPIKSDTFYVFAEHLKCPVLKEEHSVS